MLSPSEKALRGALAKQFRPRSARRAALEAEAELLLTIHSAPGVGMRAAQDRLGLAEVRGWSLVQIDHLILEIDRLRGIHAAQIAEAFGLTMAELLGPDA